MAQIITEAALMAAWFVPFGLGLGLICRSALEWRFGDGNKDAIRDNGIHFVIGIGLILGAVALFSVIYLAHYVTQEEPMEQIKVYSESGTLISQYDYVTNVHYTHYGHIAFTADDGTSVVVSGGTIIREKQ